MRIVDGDMTMFAIYVLVLLAVLMNLRGRLMLSMPTEESHAMRCRHCLGG